MNPNEALITKFYTAFQQRDYKTMQTCYADKATFNDPVFTNLNGAQVKAMWEMLCRRSADDFKLDFKNIKSDGSTAAAQWTAGYTFTATGRKVVNRIRAKFVIENGLIIKHTDHFNFYTWARQAFGFTGALLGWTLMFKTKVMQTAAGNLDKFMQKISTTE
jgi:ketosteroid isomerase-like protein